MAPIFYFNAMIVIFTENILMENDNYLINEKERTGTEFSKILPSIHLRKYMFKRKLIEIDI